MMLDQNYFYLHPLRPIYQVSNSYQSGISYLRRHFPGVFPSNIDRYFDPFLGDGGMYFGVSAHKKFVNDYSMELMGFYELVRDRNKEFCDYLHALSDTWDLLENLADDFAVECYKEGDDQRLMERVGYHRATFERITFCNRRVEFLVKDLQTTLVSWARRFRRVEYYKEQKSSNTILDSYSRLSYMECAHKAGLYEHVKSIYNEIKEISVLKIACWYFLRRYCYKGIFRKNRQGHFTSPYGGVAMNPHLPDIDVEYWYNSDLTLHLKQTNLETMDFLDFLVDKQPKGDDFVFVDPPEVNQSSIFVESKFTYDDHRRLAEWLTTKCQSQWMVFLKRNARIEEFYKKKNSHIMYFSDTFKSRYFFDNENAKILLIKNY